MVWYRMGHLKNRRWRPIEEKDEAELWRQIEERCRAPWSRWEPVWQTNEESLCGKLVRRARQELDKWWQSLWLPRAQ